MSKPTLLVFDGNAELRAHVTRALRKCLPGGVVIETGSIEDAINLAEQENVDLIVSGFGKALRFGEDLARLLSQRGNETPLLFYSSHETTRFDMGGKHWSVVQVLNPDFHDLVEVVSGVFGHADEGGSASPRKSQ